MDLDNWLKDIKAIKIWTYMINGFSESDGKNLREFLTNLKNNKVIVDENGEVWYKNIYRSSHGFPAILLINSNKENPGGAGIEAVIKLKNVEGEIDDNIFYFPNNKINKNDTFWEESIRGRDKVFPKDTSADKNNLFYTLNDKIKIVLKDKKDSLMKFSNDASQMAASQMIMESKQRILYGPPGTGKTRKARLMAAKIADIKESEVDNEIEKDGRIKLIQFHPSYSYYDFVEGIEIGQDGFELKDKIFKMFAEKAKRREESDENNNYVLIIDEINRANMASVFGELLYALEYRGKEINTSGGTLVVPDNLYIIGTMNTADVSIAEIDYAVRRRFDFVKMNSRMPDGKFQDAKNNEYKIRGDSIFFENTEHRLFEWCYEESDNLSSYKVGNKWFISNLYNRVRIDIQNSVARGIDVEDIMPGISYFLVNANSDNINSGYNEDHLQYKIDYEIVPLLMEYAKNGLFSKRYKIEGDDSLYELLKKMEYSNRLKDWIKIKKELGEEH